MKVAELMVKRYNELLDDVNWATDDKYAEFRVLEQTKYRQNIVKGVLDDVMKKTGMKRKTLTNWMKYDTETFKYIINPGESSFSFCFARPALLLFASPAKKVGPPFIYPPELGKSVVDVMRAHSTFDGGTITLGELKHVCWMLADLDTRERMAKSDGRWLKSFMERHIIKRSIAATNDFKYDRNCQPELALIDQRRKSVFRAMRMIRRAILDDNLEEAYPNCQPDVLHNFIVKGCFLDWGAGTPPPTLIEPRGDDCFVPILGVKLEIDGDEELNT